MSIGKLAEFNVRSGNWTLFVERAQMYFTVNKVEKELWLPTLISAMGDEAYELLSNLTSPELPSSLAYEAVVQVMKDHLQPQPSVMAERYRFRQRRQQHGENILNYISDLKKLAKNCEFKGQLEENLRDQLVCGLKSEVVRQRLFAEQNLLYANAVKIACTMEAAERDAAVVVVTTGLGEGGVLHLAGAAAARGRTPRGTRRTGLGRQGDREDSTCRVCGANGHISTECRYRKFVCGKCRQVGHLRRMCSLSKSNPRSGQSHDQYQLAADVQEEAEVLEGSGSELEEELHQLCLNSYKAVSLLVNIDNIKLPMEIDTGSLVSCISKDTYDRYFSKHAIEKSNITLKVYNGSMIVPLGIIKPLVKYGKVQKELELFVIKGGTTSLLGRQWLAELEMSIPFFTVNNLSNGNKQLYDVIHRYEDLFAAGLGRFTGSKARLRVREGAVPVFCRARPLPYALRERVDAELDAMLAAGIIEPVDAADWATPLVPVRKADGGLRLCVDYKVTLNPVLVVDRYPLPRIDDLLVSMNGARVFSKVDLSQAYNQVELEDPDNLTVINTHRGLFKYKRLVFGLASSPGIFQKIMSQLMRDIPNVEVFLDDVIIGNSTETEHLKTLEMVLQRLRDSGMRLKKSKCVFMVDEIKYLGYIISKDGVKVDKDKVNAIMNISRPSNVTELRSFIGMLNFYAKFIKNLSTILAPLYRLLKKGTVWSWSCECESAFRKVKAILTSAEVLAHYDPKQPLYLTCDASARGIGGVLTQRAPVPGNPSASCERPVVYVSRSLTPAEKYYSQIEREALAIVYCCERLHQYLFGRAFTLRTDHKPLVTIFGPKSGIPIMAASRLQRWAIKLSAYMYNIEYVRSGENAADGLSRLPEDGPDERLKVPEQTHFHFAQSEILLDYKEIKKQTCLDPLLSRVLLFIRGDWPSTNEIVSMGPYYNRKMEMYEELGCVMWGHRIVVPEGCRQKVLSLVHEGHMGIVKTKAYARSYVWWPGMDEAIERVCKECTLCAAEADAPPRHAAVPWPWPSRPWARVHIDFLGPIAGKIFLVMVDARTKWIEAMEVPSTAAKSNIAKISEVFARWGFPRQIVSDNGPPFTSVEFAEYLRRNGIEHIFSAPYHPSSNGAAENAVRTVKKAVKKAIRAGYDINTFLSTFLLNYRNTEHCTTGESPASLMLGRKVRTKMDALRPDVGTRVRAAQEKQKVAGPSGCREYQVGDEVWLRQQGGSEKWVAGRVIERMGVSDYKVVDMRGREWHKHVDQLRDQKQRSGVCVLGAPESAASTPITLVSSNPGHSRSPARLARENEFPDCRESPGVLPSAPEPTQPRPVRQCRLLNSPRYKF